VKERRGIKPKGSAERKGKGKRKGKGREGKGGKGQREREREREREGKGQRERKKKKKKKQKKNKVLNMEGPSILFFMVFELHIYVLFPHGLIEYLEGSEIEGSERKD